MLFASLDVVLRAVGARVDVLPSARLSELDGPAWMQNLSESHYRYSKAAGLLDHLLITEPGESVPRWFDMRDGTGYPRPSDVAREDGIAFMVEQAQWYPRWLTFNREFRARSTTISSRWGGPPTEVDYARECPPQPSSSERFAKRVCEIGFDGAAIIAFLDRLAVPHTLRLPGAPEPAPAGDVEGSPRNPDVNAPLPVVQDGMTSVSTPSHNRPGNRTASRGRRSSIDKALQQALSLAGPEGDDADVVFALLHKIASKNADCFPNLRYENGEVWYRVKETERRYTRKALAEYLRRRKKQRVQRLTCETGDTLRHDIPR